MEIIFKGNHNNQQAAESLISVINMFKERYNIVRFREMHLTVTLMDEQGDDVELVDNETNEVYRVFEICRDGRQLSRKKHNSTLKLVVDNT